VEAHEEMKSRRRASAEAGDTDKVIGDSHGADDVVRP